MSFRLLLEGNASLSVESVAIFGWGNTIEFLEEAAEVKFISEAETFSNLFDFQICADHKLNGLLVESAIQVFLGCDACVI